MPAGESEDRSKTRERFNEAFKKYTESEKKKSKKRGTETKEKIVLQSLRQNLNLEKDTEDNETILQNTYDPEQGSLCYTKNQTREREIKEKVNIDNSKKQDAITTPKSKSKSKRDLPTLHASNVNTDHILEDPGDSRVDISALDPDVAAGGKELKRKSKKGKIKGRTEGAAEYQVEDAEERLLHAYQQQIEQEEEKTVKKTKAEKDDKSDFTQNISLNNDMGKKKKKKLKSVTTESDAGYQEEQIDHDADVKNKTVSKGKKKKAKTRHGDWEENEAEPEEPQNGTFDADLVLGLFIHRTDPLKTDLLISHPMVKIHLVDETTGQYLKKENCHRPVSSYYEQESVHHILPIITQPFDFKRNKSIVPEWQEQIIFNERFGYFVEDNDRNPKVILFFEILDFMTMEETKANTNADKHEQGFRKIAWAFLKLVGTNGVLNIDNKLRLQLFCPLPRAKRQPKTIEVFEWWRKHPRTKYASTLYVTVKGIKLPEHVDPCVQSMMALQRERGSTFYSELQNEVNKKSLTQPPDSNQPVLRWSRLPGQMCRVPNKHILAFRGGQMGCFTVLFSRAGTMLAAACADRDAFPVVVYEIPSGTVLAAFSGHLKIVYDLCWSRDDSSLLSASSDGTVREWNVERLVETAQKVLPHPSFVYCAQYHPNAQNLVVTGSYDCLIRVWRLDVDDVNGQLLQELEGHSSFINTLCFDFEGCRMFSADNTGIIIVWKTTVNESRHGQTPCHHWSMEKQVDEGDLRGVAISLVQLHPNGRCLLIHAKDSLLRMMDLRLLVVKKYTGATNYRERIYSTFTPCGTFIFSGSEDGMAYVWNTDTGDQVAVYSELCYHTALHGVSFHPYENMVAFCACGENQPVHVYLYHHKVSRLELQSRTASADQTVRNTPDSLPLQYTSASSALDDFTHTARLVMKRQFVKEHFDSVPIGLNQSLSPSSVLSPHSKELQIIPPAALGSQTRGFSPVAQPPKGAPAFREWMTFPDHVSSGFYAETDSLPAKQVVVSLYDYKANRSDELTIRRGDVIQVLFKDKENDTWWFGRLVSGLQGYFPAIYVVDQCEFRDEAAEVHTALSDKSLDRSTPTRVSAVVTSSGELKFLSELTFSDTEPELSSTKTRKKRKVKKPRETAASVCQTDSSGWTTTRRGRRPLPKRPTGQTNRAYEPAT